MSFSTLNKDLLRQVGEDFAVDFPEDATKKEMIAALAEEGVTWDMYKQAFPSEDDQDDADEKPVADEKDDEEPKDAKAKYSASTKKVLLKMNRTNGTYEVRGHKFTKAHPFLPVSEEDANYILDNIEGFKIATPREAEEYYS